MGVLYKILVVFLRGVGGSGPSQKNPYQKKLRWSKKGEGGTQFLFTKSKKKIFLRLHSGGELWDSLLSVDFPPPAIDGRY